MASLVDNLVAEGDFHLTEAYSEYTAKIQSVVYENASVKVYDDLRFLGEAFDEIKMTLEQL